VPKRNVKKLILGKLDDKSRRQSPQTPASKSFQQSSLFDANNDDQALTVLKRSI